MLVNLCKPFTVAAALLWAFTAYSDDMCDQLEGVLLELYTFEVDFQQSEVFEMASWEWEVANWPSIQVESGTPSATLPGASQCLASTSNEPETIVYSCKWDEAPPRSEFDTFRGRVGACLEQHDSSYGKGSYSDEGQAFVSVWPSQDNWWIELKAYKVTSKGMILTYRARDDDAAARRRAELRAERRRLDEIERRIRRMYGSDAAGRRASRDDTEYKGIQQDKKRRRMAPLGDFRFYLDLGDGSRYLEEFYERRN